MTPAGYNPLRWRCEDRGCYNVVHRPKIEVFAENFPGRIAMTDIDATVEVNGFFLFLEFKGGQLRAVPTGQRIYFERLTCLSTRIHAAVVHADAQTMECNAIATFHNGVMSDFQPINLEGLKSRLMAWANHAASYPVRIAA
jgi:hypothetical protein